MKTGGGIFLAFMLVIAVSVLVIAQPKAPDMLPDHAREVSKGIFSLGQAVDVDGRIVEGFLIVDRKENAKPPWAGGAKPDKSDSKCYAFLAKGAKWKSAESYVASPEVDLSLMETSANTWDSEVDFDIFGEGFSNFTNGPDDVSPDGQNEVEFQNLGATNTIAYTIVWGIFGGPPGQRELVEWDMVFNSNYPWSLSGELGKMDFQNIATHELGHSLGLGHPPEECTEETMYAYADYGEIKKRDLNSGDIVGINELY
jgi:hypothetical protein